MRRYQRIFLGFATLHLLMAALLWPQTFPPRPAEGDLIDDEAHLLNANDRQQVQNVCEKLFREQRTPIVVVTIPSLANYDALDIQSYARALFDNWGIGSQAKNDGILLLVSVGDRKARIELGGAWGSGKNDAAQMIMNEILVPNFRKGDYSAGILQGVNALDTMARGHTVRKPYSWVPFALICALLALGVVVAISLIRSGKAGWGWALLALIAAAVVGLLALASRLPGKGDSYGGGSSGGGGATGSW